MCYNCGCGDPNDHMGHPESITNETFEAAAKAEGQSVEEAKKNAFELLKRELGK